MLAFVHIEKTAGITLLDILQQSFGGRHAVADTWRRPGADYISAEDLRLLRRWNGGVESISGHFVKPYSDLDAECDRLDYWTMVREPLARCASHYQYQVQKMAQSSSFEEWIHLPGSRNFMTRKLAGVEDLAAAKRILKERIRFVGLMEAFDESLLLWRAQFSAYPLDIGYRRRNVARDNHIKETLLQDEGARRELENANRLDCDLYSHVVEEIYPEQRRRYPGALAQDLQELSNRPTPKARSARRWQGKLKNRLWLGTMARFAGRGVAR